MTSSATILFWLRVYANPTTLEKLPNHKSEHSKSSAKNRIRNSFICTNAVARFYILMVETFHDHTGSKAYHLQPSGQLHDASLLYPLLKCHTFPVFPNNYWVISSERPLPSLKNLSKLMQCTTSNNHATVHKPDGVISKAFQVSNRLEHF